MPGPPAPMAADATWRAAPVENAWSNFDRSRIQPLDPRAPLPFISSGPRTASVPYRGDRFGGGGGGGGRFGFRGADLEKIEWNRESIVPVQKDFAEDHPNVKSRTDEECEMIRLKHGIEVKEHPPGVDVPKPIDSFEETSFPDWAAEVLRQQAWTEPTPIQIQAWPVALHGFDIVGIAPTGSGKTMAYVLPMLVHIIAQPELKPGEGPVGLVLQPTRELCTQVKGEISAFTPYTNIRCESIVGGDDHSRQGMALVERVDIIVATPGRLIDLLNARRTNLRRVTYVVLDEADDLLDRGFGDQVKLIMSQVRPDRQVLLFSATWQGSMEAFAEEVCREKRGLSPGTIQITVGGTKLAACKTIDQQFWSPGKAAVQCRCNQLMVQLPVTLTKRCRDCTRDVVSPAEVYRCRECKTSLCTDCADKIKLCFWPTKKTKIEMLVEALKRISDELANGASKALVFCNRSETVPFVVDCLKRNGIACEGFTTESAATRTEVLQRFKDNQSDIPILVATQVLGRGHDFHNVSYVVNYDYPTRLRDYIHRIGRTGRNQTAGFALTLLEETDLRCAKEIVACLRETGHNVEPWLFEEARPNKRATAWRSNQGTSGGEKDVATWRGRGAERRCEFSAELQSQGRCGGT